MSRDAFNIIKVDYDKLRKKGLSDDERGIIISEIVTKSTNLLATADRISLKSKVANKSYFAFALNGTQKFSRAINESLYAPDINGWHEFIGAVKTQRLREDQKQEISKILYTAAISFCAVNDLFKVGDQKTPGTFFEYFISYLLKLCLKVEPVTSIKVLDYDGLDVNLQTDKIFNLGKNMPKYHVPIKTSTRERAIMLWAHQKLLDGVYGIEKFIGTPVLLAENKVDIAKKEVVEICLPDQWLVYQLYISKLKRIYYLDMPEAYKRLALNTPPIHVKPLSEFFFEWQSIYS